MFKKLSRGKKYKLTHTNCKRVATFLFVDNIFILGVNEVLSLLSTIEHLLHHFSEVIFNSDFCFPCRETHNKNLILERPFLPTGIHLMMFMLFNIAEETLTLCTF